MKRFLIIAIIATIGGFSVMAQNNPVNNQTPTTKEHRNFIVDNGVQTDLVISFDETNVHLVVEGLGESESYIASVVPAGSPQMVVIEDIVNAADNIVDVSMLNDGTYIITLTDPVFGSQACRCTFVIASGLPGHQPAWNVGPLNRRDFSNMKK
jgi:hypothetical protein